ncbi:hypothetical protein [Mucilaginibacter sp.]|uniref:hypothetical protein n=1 Tax=Mucilaginibacter sp. TaxID=1882438 RepID=UPI002615B378|nr:hypothetical protein [Mucilaginibacter sp.]
MRKTIFSRELAVKFKMEEKDFTRNRKRPFSATLLFMFNLLRKSLAIEIDGFVRYLNDHFSSSNTKHFTSSAFVQNRKKISPAVFNHLSEVIIENFYTADNDSLILLNGFRILAVDGSRIMLPFTDELKKCYGTTKNQFGGTIVQGRASVLYDVLTGLPATNCCFLFSSVSVFRCMTKRYHWNNVGAGTAFKLKQCSCSGVYLSVFSGTNQYAADVRCISHFSIKTEISYPEETVINTGNVLNTANGRFTALTSGFCMFYGATQFDNGLVAGNPVLELLLCIW